MEKYILDEKEALEYIKQSIDDSKVDVLDIDKIKYHHNSTYKNAASICKNGILTMKDLVKYGIKDYSEEFLYKMDDTESHANGNDGVSLSVMGLTDFYRGEYEYDPTYCGSVDFRVTDDIIAGRNGIRYGNEFIHRGSISVDKIKALDIRFYQLLLSAPTNEDGITTKKVIEYYNNLKEIALMLKEVEHKIPLREVSGKENILLDIEKISKQPQLIIK